MATSGLRKGRNRHMMPLANPISNLALQCKSDKGCIKGTPSPSAKTSQFLLRSSFLLTDRTNLCIPFTIPSMHAQYSFLTQSSYQALRTNYSTLNHTATTTHFIASLRRDYIAPSRLRSWSLHRDWSLKWSCVCMYWEKYTINERSGPRRSRIPFRECRSGSLCTFNLLDNNRGSSCFLIMLISDCGGMDGWMDFVLVGL